MIAFKTKPNVFAFKLPKMILKEFKKNLYFIKKSRIIYNKTSKALINKNKVIISKYKLEQIVNIYSRLKINK